MILAMAGLDNHVINIDLHFFVYHIMKEGNHGSLICCSGILEAKRHDPVTKNAQGVVNVVFSLSSTAILT